MNAAQTSQAPGLTMALSEDGRKLLATCTPAEDGRCLDKSALDEAIASQGFAKAYLFEAAIRQLVSQSATAKAPFTLEVGEIRDAEIQIDVAADRMTAWLTATKAFGGTPLSRDRIMQALAEKKISQGMLQEAIDRALADGVAEKIVVAQGRRAVDGEDGKLRPLVELSKERRPHFDSHGVADYRELGTITNVRQGERLMQRIPPSAGEPGVDVYGQVLPAKPGKDVRFAPQLSGTQLDPSDANYLVAAISGQPVLAPDGMIVEPTLTLKTADLSTGNVNFEGSITISGDVQPGLSLYATGDIHVGGTVEAATLEAGGDIAVKGGIIGHAVTGEAAKEAGKQLNARVRAGGSCSALFAENASIEAGDSIMIEKLVRHSELAAPNQIIVGQPGSGQGSIIGGSVRATVLVHAGTIGSAAGIKTRIAVGNNPFLSERMSRLTKEIGQKAKEIEDVGRILTFMAENPSRGNPALKKKAENTREQLAKDMAALQGEKEDLATELNLAEDAKVEIENTVYTNVQIEIGGKVKRVEVERSAGIFLLKDDEIEFI